MNKRVMWVAVLVLISASLSSAEVGLRKIRTPQDGRVASLDLSSEPAVAPLSRMEVDEFLLKRNELQGSVIELRFDRVSELKQTQNGYMAAVRYEGGRGAQEVRVLVPEEGLDLFGEWTKMKPGTKERTDIYVQVMTNGLVRALGERYSKSKPEGDRYSW